LRDGRNRVCDMLVTLEAVKPARAGGEGPIIQPQLRLSSRPRLMPHFAALPARPVPAAAPSARPVAAPARVEAFQF
jgi:hypothetical protein